MGLFGKKEKPSGTVTDKDFSAIRTIINAKQEHVTYLINLVRNFIDLCNKGMQTISNGNDIESAIYNVNSDIVTMESISLRLGKTQKKLKDILSNQKTFIVGISRFVDNCIKDIGSPDYEKVIKKDKSLLSQNLEGFSKWFLVEKNLLATYLK